MLKFHYSEGKYIPRLLCDICGKSIENADRAIVVNRPHTDSFKDEMLDAMVVHRGDCDLSATQKLGVTHTGSADLDHYLFNLIHNIGLTLDELSKRSERYDRLNDL